jgi:hypothetical protein
VQHFPHRLTFTHSLTFPLIYQVKSLCVHETNHPELEFVVAVRAFPLVNDLVSLWVFVGTLEVSGDAR